MAALTPDARDRIKQVFSNTDRDQDGHLDKLEVKSALTTLTSSEVISEAMIDKLFKSAADDGRGGVAGKLSYDRFEKLAAAFMATTGDRRGGEAHNQGKKGHKGAKGGQQVGGDVRDPLRHLYAGGTPP